MAHHGSGELDEEFRKMLKKQEKNFGATERFPEGKLNEADEGEIKFGVTEKDGKVVLNFGKEIKWMAATPEQAKDLAGSLLNKAREAES